MMVWRGEGGRVMVFTDFEGEECQIIESEGKF
jgi:hypothetical protein